MASKPPQLLPLVNREPRAASLLRYADGPHLESTHTRPVPVLRTITLTLWPGLNWVDSAEFAKFGVKADPDWLQRPNLDLMDVVASRELCAKTAKVEALRQWATSARPTVKKTIEAEIARRESNVRK